MSVQNVMRQGGLHTSTLYCVGHDDDSGQHARYGLSVSPQSTSDAWQVSALRMANPADILAQKPDARFLGNLVCRSSVSCRRIR